MSAAVAGKRRPTRADKFPYLTREQERTASPDLLILSHGRFVEKMAKRFARYGLDVEDLIQEGTIGLMSAARKFDPGKGFRFATYARWWVRERMTEAVFRGGSIVRPNTGPNARAGYFRARPHRDISMDVPARDGDTTFADTFACTAPLPDEVAEAAIDGEARSASLRRALDALPARDADIIQSRFLSDPKQPLEVVGARLGISKERVRQLEEKALEKLKGAMLRR